MAGTTQQETRWLSDEEQRDWRSVLRGYRLLTESLDESLGEHGTRLTEYEIISMLSEAPGRRLRMSVLADLVIQSRSRLTHTATRLEGRGWVERRTCLDDRRGVELTLTDAGAAALEGLSRVHVASVRASILDLLTPEQFAGLGAAMRTVESALGHDEGTESSAAGQTPAADSDLRGTA